MKEVGSSDHALRDYVLSPIAPPFFLFPSSHGMSSSFPPHPLHHDALPHRGPKSNEASKPQTETCERFVKQIFLSSYLIFSGILS